MIALQRDLEVVGDHEVEQRLALKCRYVLTYLGNYLLLLWLIRAHKLFVGALSVDRRERQR